MISINRGFREIELPESEPVFSPGQLVRHVRYGYRGVVVVADGFCKADPSWYMSNKTQPDRQQPWYHVLVNDSSVCTYAAQTSLAADAAGQPIANPLVEHFFSAFEDGRHLRNDREWPG